MLAALRQGTHVFHWAAQTDFHRDNQRTVELDILAIADGRVIVGEAKRREELEPTAQEERRAVARCRYPRTSLTADTLVFASRTTWLDRTRDAITKAVRTTDLDVQYLENLGS